MKDRLRSILDEHLQREPENMATPRIDAIFRRGDRLRWRRHVSVIALVATVGGLGGLGLTAAGGYFGDDPTPRIDIAQYQPAPPVSDSGADAVVVAVRALAEVGLLDPEGTLYDYRYAVSDGGSWTIGFDAMTCTPTELLSSCQQDPRGDAELVVDQEDNSFVIREARGPMTDEQREELVGHAAPRTDGPPRWEFPYATVAGPAQRSVVGIPLWIGPIASASHGSSCTPRVVGPSGTTVWTGNPIDLISPYREDARSGQLQYQQPIPDGLDEHAAVFSCDNWTGSGWRVAGAARPSQEGGGRDHIPVDVPVSWRGQPFADAYTRCVVEVFDEGGAEIGEGETTLLPPGRGSETDRSVDRVVQVLVRVESGRAPDRASAECRLIHRVEFAEE